MPSPRTHHRKGSEDKNRTLKGKLPEKSVSFHGQSSSSGSAELLRRPRTVPDLLSSMKTSASDMPVVDFQAMKLTKLLVNVTIQRSVGPVQVLISLDSRVEDLIAAALRQYAKEGRRPVISPGDYDLHYSQFSLESLDKKEKLTALGSRNFFLCPKNGVVTTSPTRCGKQADAANKFAVPWLKFMDFLR